MSEDRTEGAIQALKTARDALESLTVRDLKALKACLNQSGCDPVIHRTLTDLNEVIQGISQQVGLVLPGDATSSRTTALTIVGGTASPETGTTGRRIASNAYDFALFFAIHHKRNDRPVSHKSLVEFLSALDPTTKDGSITTKRGRLKEQGLIEWRTTSDLQITGAGVQRMEDLKRYLLDEEREAIQGAFEAAWGMDVAIR